MKKWFPSQSLVAMMDALITVHKFFVVSVGMDSEVPWWKSTPESVQVLLVASWKEGAVESCPDLTKGAP